MIPVNDYSIKKCPEAIWLDSKWKGNSHDRIKTQIKNINQPIKYRKFSDEYL